MLSFSGVKMQTQMTNLLLLAPGFDSELTERCVSRLRKSGRAVFLVGLIPGMVRSRDGLQLMPDMHLDELALANYGAWLFLPGGRDYAAALARDPRVYRLVQAVHANGGCIAATPDVQGEDFGVPLVPITGELI